MPAKYSETISLAEYSEYITSPAIVEADCHHVLSSGNHGRKAHLDRIVQGTPMYEAGIRHKAEKIRRIIPITRSLVIIGIANGTNQEAVDIADYIDDGILGLSTVKTSKRTVELSDDAREIIKETEPQFAVFTEDVSTKGTVCASVVPEVRALGVRHLLMVPTLQREAALPRLDELGVPYEPLVFYDLPSYSPEECAALDEGLCHSGVPLKQYGED